MYRMHAHSPWSGGKSLLPKVDPQGAVLPPKVDDLAVEDLLSEPLVDGAV